jgi:predicted transcriptional regulator
LKEEGVEKVDVGTVVRASSEILAVKGQDLFNKLSPAVKELTVQLYREGGSSYSSLLARKMGKTQGRISQMLVELRDLGYVKDERKKNKMMYTLCRALHRYLEQTFGEAETFKNQREDETVSGGKRE